MIDAPHFGFVVAAYAIAAVVDPRHDRRGRAPIIARKAAALRRLEEARRTAGRALSAGEIGAPRRRGLLTLLPLLIFGALALLFFARLFAGDASRIPSALIGQSAPPLDLPALDGAAGLKDADLRQGHVSVVNVFASWCLPCHEEHGVLLDLAADKALGRQRRAG